MSDSAFYETDPNDPDAPVVLSEYASPYGIIRPGDVVEYVNPDAPPLRGRGALVVNELLQWTTPGSMMDLGGGPVPAPEVVHVQAVLDDGQEIGVFEVNADNLRPHVVHTTAPL